MKRHTITEGARTTAGGKVVAGSSHGSINGASIALENDPIFCKACKSSGRIYCVGPRLPETWDGKQVALENDLCICACSPPPRLIASQAVHYQVIDDSGAAAQIQPSTAAAVVMAEIGGNSDLTDLEQYFEVCDSNGTSVDLKYRIDAAGKRLSEDALSSKGETQAFPIDTDIALVFWKNVT